jgi:LPXTG-motif cell wall-anchored protein
MKKLALTIAIVLGLGLTSFAEGNQGGGLFQRGAAKEMSNRDGETPMLPNLPTHNQTGNQDAPLGSGIALLLGLGGAYLVAKKRREE